jgi:HD-GYP domain-containing protein (c-di-GMP phosphodiesterase class II)
VSQATPNLQIHGRKILAVFHAALRALKLYPIENAAVQQAIDELHAMVTELTEREGTAELRIVGDFFFLNETRLRLDLSNFSSFGSFSQALAQHGIGRVEVEPGVRREEWVPFLSLLLRPPTTEVPYLEFVERLARAPAEHLHVQPETEPGEEDADEQERQAMQAAKRTYAQSVKVAKDVLRDVRLGRAVNLRQVKRTVQNIVDQVLSNEPSMITLTTLRDFDEYTFTHCVNVSIFSVVIGQRLKMDKMQLYELGLGGLLHDVGKMHLDAAIINKPGQLDENEWAQLREHPTKGLLALFHMVGFADMPYRQMLVAYEHHMKTDLTGYPTNKRERKPGLFSRIVAVADGFDAGTSVRSYQYQPWPADRVLKEMRENPKRGFDALLVKALITATGVFPIGMMVILDTFEVGVVCAVNPDPSKLHLPKVKVISDAMGFPLAQPVVVDLSETDDAGRPLKQILKTTDAQKYGINVSDYLT